MTTSMMLIADAEENVDSIKSTVTDMGYGSSMQETMVETFLTMLDLSLIHISKGEPVLKITIKHFDTDRIDTISFYETDGNILVVTGDPFSIEPFLSVQPLPTSESIESPVI